MFNKRSVWHDGWLIMYSTRWAIPLLRGLAARARDATDQGREPPRYTAVLRDDIAARIGHGAAIASTRSSTRRAYKEWTIHTENQFEMMPEPAMRFQLAALLRASGAVDSARALFSSLTLPTTWMGFYTARASLELAELSEETRDLPTAQRAYLAAARMWERGDSSIAALRDRAKRGSSRVGEGVRR
jgi:hypothetical protein